MLFRSLTSQLSAVGLANEIAGFRSEVSVRDIIATYPYTEHATVLEGEVELTVAGGEPQRFAPGDSWFVKQGTEVEWKILTPRFVKHYLANVETR